MAAAVLLTGTGLVVSTALQSDSSVLSLIASDRGRQKVASNLRQIGQAIAMYKNDFTTDYPRTMWGDNGQTAHNVYGRPKNSLALPKDQFDSINLPSGTTASNGAADAYYWKDGGASGGFGGGSPRQFGMGAPQSANEPAQKGAEAGKPSNYSLAFRPTDQWGLQVTGGGEKDGDRIAGRKLREAGDDKAPSQPPTPAPATEGKPEVVEDGIALGRSDAAPPADQPGKPVTTSTPMPAAPPPPPSQHQDASAARKIIRNGTIEFEVDRFDDAVMRITKLVDEQGGFVATTDSDKLPNGHVKGTITLRVPPEHLDTLVLTLRGLGDLKSQKITAEDITKHYTDLESELRAARAMEDRLLEIIKTANGQIKDLLVAEKELGVWREKIEAIEGEKRYLDGQISLSTLVVSLYEKDIRTPAYATETEQVQMSLETETVDDAYNKALEAIKSAKGRITQSELKQYDAGQFGATIVAAVPPDAAEQVIARLRQLSGRIAHFSRDRHQTTQTGAPLPAASTQIQRDDTILNLQIYNLANIAPRRTTTLQVAAALVDRTYAQLVEQVRSAGGRIVTSALAKPDANTQTADVDFQVPTEKADAILDVIRGYGEVMQQDLSENPDTANVTEAKRGFHLRLVSLAAVPARETQTLQLAAAGVPQAFNDILAAAQAAGARVYQSDLSEQNPQDVTAAITVEVPRAGSASLDAAVAKASQVLTRTVNRSAELDKTVDTKVRIAMSLASADRLPPRQTIAERIEVQDVERASDDLVNSAVSAGGRRIGNGEMTQDKAGHVTSEVVVEVPLNKAGTIVDELERSGSRRSKQVSFNSAEPENPLSRARIDVTFSNSAASLGGEETTWDAIRNGLSVSGRGLRWSLQMLVVGFCFVAPWIFVLWLIWKLIRRNRNRPAIPAA